MRLVAICLAVWFVVSFGCGILLVDFLNRFTIGGFQLGFWFAQQGSMYVFLVIVFVYAARMTVLDRRHGVREDDEEAPQNPPGTSHSLGTGAASGPAPPSFVGTSARARSARAGERTTKG